MNQKQNWQKRQKEVRGQNGSKYIPKLWSKKVFKNQHNDKIEWSLFSVSIVRYRTTTALNPLFTVITFLGHLSTFTPLLFYSRTFVSPTAILSFHRSLWTVVTIIRPVSPSDSQTIPRFRTVDFPVGQRKQWRRGELLAAGYETVSDMNSFSNIFRANSGVILEQASPVGPSCHGEMATSPAFWHSR